jgi:hypothetical protein
MHHPEDLAAHTLYRQLRGDLLRAATRHRRAVCHPDLLTDVHRSHLDVCRRQLGALRQAWRRTREAAEWNRYVRERAMRCLPRALP